jgi:tetratricopeptide (TPR) repeat protein
MNPKVLRRFIVLTAVLTFAMFSFWMGWRYLSPSQPGDFETRHGGQLLSDGHYEEAIEEFNAALDLEPDHRGALQGLAREYLEVGCLEDAEEVFTDLFVFLEWKVEEVDLTGRGVLYSDYAIRGTFKDRQGRYQEALEDYIAAIQVDAELAEGPGFIDRLLYHNRKPSSVLGRANYLYEQLQLPEEDRLLRVPELDAQQRMYQP